MRKTPVRLTSLVLSLLAGLLLLPAASQAGTIFGSRLNHDPANSGECESLGPCTIVSFIHPSEPNGDPYSGGAPVSGVITSFRLRAYAPEPTQVTLRLAEISRPEPADPSSALATATGTGPTVTFQHTEEPSIQEFPARLAVKKGQHLAIDATDLQATYNNSGDKFSYIFTPPLVDGGGARGSLEATGELLVQATIEPDADNDGFGDETQDKCPTQASTQGPCDTTAPVVGGAKVSGGVLSYVLSEAATVSLQLEKKSVGRKAGGKCVRQTKKNKSHARCPLFKKVGAAFSGGGAAGPNKVTLANGKKLKPGSYRVTITATDAAGNKSVATSSFRVKAKKPKRR